jgi:hypothetical protein
MAASPNSARALKWEFFLTRWQQAYDLVASASAAAAAADAAPRLLSPREAARLEMLVAKAERARAALAQLREFDARHRAMVTRYGPVADSLPALRRKLREEGRQPSSSVAAAAATTAPDPFGIRAATTTATTQQNPSLGLLRSWAEHRAALARVARAASELSGSPQQRSQQQQRGPTAPPAEQLSAFNRERRALLAEASSLRRQLLHAYSGWGRDARGATAGSRGDGGADDGDDAASPPLPALFDDPSTTVGRDCDEMEALASALRGVRAAHAVGVARALRAVDLDELDARLALRLGRQAGGEQEKEVGQAAVAARGAVARLRQVRQAWLELQERREEVEPEEEDKEKEHALGWRATSFPQEVWEQLEADAEALSGVALRLRIAEEGRRGAGAEATTGAAEARSSFVTVTDATDLNVLRAQQALYDRLSREQQ